MRRLLSAALLGATAALPLSLGAQGVSDASARLAPQVIQFNVMAPIDKKITEFAVPLYVLVPVTEALSFDLGTAWADARVESTDNNGATTTSELSGLTDTQIRANYTIGTDFVVLTAGVNLPTGKSTALPDQQEAATRIASDFLVFPITGFGTGAGGTGGIAMARPLGDWNVGLGLAMRHSVAYDPFQQADGSRLHFQPGNEYRARVGVDRPYGIGRISLGVTYSKFGRDQADQSVYNTGDRYITQASITNSVGNADIELAGWDMFRASGQLADQTPTGRENIANAGIAVGFHTAPGIVIQPNVEGRVWTQDGLPASYLTTGGLRLNVDLGGYAITPFAGYTIGTVASSGGNASLTGFSASLAIRLGGGY
ncbi:MAG: hypothetical protein KGL93_06425 [Gemmatimonadota bacterium]|nr:hypothetical protein [Gemmatimonadota bacterium]